MVKLFNFWYFFFVIITAALTVGLYFLFRSKSMRSKKILIGSLLVFNFLLHFVKVFLPKYNSSPELMIENAFFINICAVSVASFPFLFFCKSSVAKDWMFYIGVISGFLAVLYPTEALGEEVANIELWRFYICHIIIFMAPLLMVLLKVHRLNYKNVWKMPFCMMAVMLFIICNQVLLSELGAIPLRGDDITEAGCGYRNTSLIWGPTDSIAAIFTWLTPDFMKTIPFGEFRGQEKFWPFFYLVPGIIFFFLIIPMLLCLIWEHKHIKDDFYSLRKKLKKQEVNKQC